MHPCILVTDDDANVRTGLIKLIRRLGYTVLEAASGEEALQLLSNPDSEAIDLLITDIFMPQMSGIELLKAVHAIQPDLPVAIITGSASLDSSIAALNAGAYAYLTKPIDRAQVRDVVTRGLQRLTERQAHEQKLLDRYQELEHQLMLMQTNQQDITHMETSQDPLADLILGLRHELGNATTAIKLNLSVLEEEGNHSDQIKEHLRDLQATTDELVALLGRLRQYPNSPVARELIDLRQILVSLVDTERSRLEGQSVQLDATIPEHEIPVYGTEMELSRSFLHIIQNAVEATEEMAVRQVRVAVLEEANSVSITISDNGPGFPEAALEQPFSPGYTTKITDGMMRGLGLGLFITRATINLYGGRIWLENRPEGGASIHIALPLVQNVSYSMPHTPTD